MKTESTEPEWEKRESQMVHLKQSAKRRHAENRMPSKGSGDWRSMGSDCGERGEPKREHERRSRSLHSQLRPRRTLQLMPPLARMELRQEACPGDWVGSFSRTSDHSALGWPWPLSQPPLHWHLHLRFFHVDDNVPQATTALLLFPF